ncbi:MAG: GNAT family N-acetyltransferase [Kineosporiaceae bacterium]
MLTVSPEAPDSPDSRALVDELTAELATEGYPPESTHGYDVATLLARGVTFVVARVDGVPVGCGGVQVVQDPGGEAFAELKRMYVRPAHRGAGVSRAILQALAGHAGTDGVRVLRLETGVRQRAALAFYRREGFTEIPPFPPYRLDPESVFLERRLTLT